MVLSLSRRIAASIKLLTGSDAAFTTTQIDRIIDINQTNEELLVEDFVVDGAVTDQAISLGKVTSPTFIYIKWESKFNGDNSTTEDQDALVTIKVNSGTLYSANHFIAAVDDITNDTTVSTISFTTLADTDTIVSVVALGRST